MPILLYRLLTIRMATVRYMYKGEKYMLKPMRPVINDYSGHKLPPIPLINCHPKRKNSGHKLPHLAGIGGR